MVSSRLRRYTGTMRRAVPLLLAGLLLSGCMTRRLARTLGEGRGELRATTGGPFLGTVGVPLMIPSLRFGGRYGATDWLDVDGSLAIDPLGFGILAFDAGAVTQIVRVPDGFAMSASAHAHLLFDLDDDLTTRGFPELSLHAEGPVAEWLTVFGGVIGVGSIDNPEDRPPVFIAPYLGFEIAFDRRPPVREYLVFQVSWASPWEDLGGFTAWEPDGYSAIFLTVGWRGVYGEGPPGSFP